MLEIEEREKKAIKLKDDKIRAPEEQLRVLMIRLEGGETTEQLSGSDKIKHSTAVPTKVESSSSCASSFTRKVTREEARRIVHPYIAGLYWL
ncbi:hypothetical protein K1719_021424 [Acacia pycnantha]|nr:hypothetical protein K1719_021424 [Acacia pycnantha]